MRAVVIVAAIAIAGIAALAIWNAADDENGGDAPPKPAPPPETADPVPKLPRGWTKTANEAGGFALGVPPGWSAKPAGTRTTLKSRGSAVVVRVTADRSDEAFDANPSDYARDIIDRLGAEQFTDLKVTGTGDGGSGSLVVPPGSPGGSAETEELVIAYESASITATAKSKQTGRKERVQVTVVRRPMLAVYPMLVVSDSKVKAKQLDPILRRLIGSLRGRPVQPATP